MCKGRKERLTVMGCSNASRNHRLPLVVVGKAMKPRALRNLNQHLLSVNYFSKKCMDE